MNIKEFNFFPLNSIFRDAGNQQLRGNLGFRKNGSVFYFGFLHEHSKWPWSYGSVLTHGKALLEFHGLFHLRNQEHREQTLNPEEATRKGKRLGMEQRQMNL